MSEGATVIVTCGMGENCTNKERPGTHPDFEEALACVELTDPDAARRWKRRNRA